MSTADDPILPTGRTLEAGRGVDLAHTALDDHSAPAVVRPSLEAARIGRFQILHEIGAGGMGVVYAAYDAVLDRKVALKLLRTLGAHQARAGERLQREAKAMARISHPNVVQIYDVGEHGGQLYVAMEFLDGVEIAHWIDDEAPGWSAIITAFLQAGRGLQAAHEAGVVHRDFKPDNVVITRRSRGHGGEEVRAKVLDFGIAAVARGDDEVEVDDVTEPGPEGEASRLTVTGSVMGTPRYMSPEHFLGRGIDARSDQFSFAVALYEALYGERPFAGESFHELRDAVLAGVIRPAPPSEVPTWARDTLLRALARDPEERWSTMEELLLVLAEHPERTQDPDLDRTVALRQRAWMLTVLSLGASILLAVLVYLWLFAGAPDLAAFAFWSKVIFGFVAAVLVLAARQVFTRNTYNRWVAALLLSISCGTMAAAIAGQAIGLDPGEADRFVLILVAASFGQASAGISRWFGAVAAVGVVGLAISFIAPFAASLTVGACVLLGTGVTAYQWRKRARTPSSARTLRSTRGDRTSRDRSSRDRSSEG